AGRVCSWGRRSVSTVGASGGPRARAPSRRYARSQLLGADRAVPRRSDYSVCIPGRARPWPAACLMAFAAGSRWLGLGGGECQPVALEGLLDAPRGRSADALVDRQCLPQVGGGLAGVAVVQVGLAGSFQGACFLRGRAEVAGDGQRLRMVPAGLQDVHGSGRQLTEAVERLGLAEQVAQVTEQRQGLLVAGGGGRMVPG